MKTYSGIPLTVSCDNSMIITQTPLRISFLGGGTDYPEYYLKHGGETLATSINRYVTVSLHPLTQFVDYRARVHYSQLESADTIDDIRHPGARECLRLFGIEGGLEVYYADDLPARSGLGSSSTATVGLLLALHTMRGEQVSQEQLAAEAIHVEREMIKDRVGSQDQYISALGGFRHLQFLPDGAVRTERVAISSERRHDLEKRLLLLYTGRQRTAHEVLDEQVERTKTGKNDAGLSELKALVAHGVEILRGTGDLAAFGELLQHGWELKRSFSSKVSTPHVDELYERARAAGAAGGKLLGAGGGGFLLFFVEPEDRARVRQALAELPEAPFAFEEHGTRAVFDDTRRP